MDESYVHSTSENSKAPFHGSTSSGDCDRVEELGTSISDKLKINNGHSAGTIDGSQSFPVDRYYIEEEEEEEEEDEDSLSEEALLAQMGYAESDSIRDYDEEEEEDLTEDTTLVKREVAKHEPINIPTAELNLVSALKGSREKQGLSIEEWRVSWAPDVYDPPCTSDDHFAVSKNERHRVEHKVRSGSGKNKQKLGGSEGRVSGGKGSRGSGSEGGRGSKDKIKAEKKHKKHGRRNSDPG